MSEPVMTETSISGENGGKRRARSRNVEQSDKEIAILADFEKKLAEKEEKKQQKLLEEKIRLKEREKKKQEMAAFQQEIDKMLNSDSDDDQPKKDVKSYVPMNLGSVKGRWDQIEAERKKIEEEKAMKERKERQSKDDADKKKIAKEALLKDMEEMETTGGRSGRRRSEQSAPKPKKLGKGAQDFLAEAAKAEAEKVAEERRRRQMEDMKLVQNKDLHAAEDSDESEEENFKPKKELQRKPSKLTVTAEDLAKKEEEKRRQKLEVERQRRIDADRIRMEEERQNYESSEDEPEENGVLKPEVKVNKLKISLKDLEAKRDEEALQKAALERQMRKERDMELMSAEREKWKEESLDSMKPTQKPAKEIGKINLDYESIIAKKSAEEKKALTSGMQDKMEDFRNLRSMSKKYAEDDMKEREQMMRNVLHEDEERQIGKMDASKLNLDSEFAQREREMSEKLALEKVENLRAEIRMMNEAKKQLMQQEMESIENEEREEEREIQKLDSKFTNFDKEVQEKEAEEANRIRNERKKRLEDEMKRFEEEKEKFENDFEEMKTEVIQIEVGRLDSSKTSFDTLEGEREQQRLKMLKQARMKELRDEISRMELERQDWEDPTNEIESDEENGTSNTNGTKYYQVKLEPNKLNNNFEEIQKQKQQLLEQEIRLAKMQAMESELVQLQAAWDAENSEEDEEPLTKPVEKTIINPGKLDKQQLQFDKMAAAQSAASSVRMKIQKNQEFEQEVEFRDLSHIQSKNKFKQQELSQAHLYDKAVTENRPKEVKKMNANKYFEQMQKQKEEEEKERLEEQRLARAKRERDEMIEAKKREMSQQLAELEDGSDAPDEFEDEDMDGSPCFLEPLVNVTIKEGSKFRIACSIAGFPQPKVIWYHNKVPLKNGEDYQYKVNGTIYSLNMDECFREDEGIYTIRAVNDKGIDMSECNVKVIA